MQAHRRAGLALLFVLAISAGALRGLPAPSSADEPPATTGEMNLYITTEEKKLNNATVMVTVSQNGKVVRQGELDVLVTKIFDDIPAGAYEVRAESLGVETIVKHGVFVVNGKETAVRFDLRSGQGVKVIEYTAGARLTSYERLEARVAALEKELAEIRKRLRSE